MVNIAETKNTCQTFSVENLARTNHHAFILLWMIAQRVGKSTNEECLEVPDVEVRDYLEWGFTRGQYRSAISFLEKNGFIKITKSPTKEKSNVTTTRSPKIKLLSTEAYNRLSYVEKLVCNPMFDHATHLSFLSSSSPPSSFPLPPSSPVTSSPPISISLSPSLPPNYPLFCAAGVPTDAQKKNFYKTTSTGIKGLPFGIRFSYQHYTFCGLDDEGITLLEEKFPDKDVRFELWRMISWFTMKNDRKKGGGIDFVLKWLTKAVPVQQDGTVEFVRPSEDYTGFYDQVDYQQYVDERRAFAHARMYHSPQPAQPEQTWQQDLQDAIKRRDERDAKRRAEELCLI